MKTRKRKLSVNQRRTFFTLIKKKLSSVENKSDLGDSDELTELQAKLKQVQFHEKLTENGFF